ncbi:MAG: shikimate dehydrogenase [candidate division KSB1 bacterium]|nr:shikimate dehydrogenase [candidate division KSB1 bacterium]
MIKGSTDIYAVIGDPVEHSLSPLMQNYLIKLFDLDAVYAACHVRSKDLKTALAGLQALNIKGINVTLPHKIKVRAFCRTVSKDVETLGAANTITPDETGLCADVTDHAGFLESLGDRQSLFRGNAVCMLGAGGAARSILYALSQLEVDRVSIYNRTRENAEQLIREAAQSFGFTSAESVAQSELNRTIESSSIVINTTSVGMHPHIEATLCGDDAPFSRRHFVYDLIYNPLQTRLLRTAKSKGAFVQNGLDMLIFQGLQSLRIWTGQNLQADAGATKRM